MQPIAHPLGHPISWAKERLDWRDYRLFLACVEAGSFKSAAVIAGHSLNTIRSHIDRLEHSLGQILFRRSYRGLSLTAAGQDFLLIAQDMRDAGTSIDPARTAPGVSTNSNEIRLDVTEGLGSFWLVPRIGMLIEENPDALVTINCRAGLQTPNRRSTDIVVQLERPVDSEMICVRLGTFHLMPFAAPSYLARKGTPTSIQDGLDHRLVVQVTDSGPHAFFATLIGDAPRPGLVAVQTNASSAYFVAIAQGTGIGMLPTYVAALTDAVVPVDMELKLRSDIWLTYHPDAKRSSTTLKTIAWIRDSFDSSRFPWFDDRFIHPSSFTKHHLGYNLTDVLGGVAVSPPR